MVVSERVDDGYSGSSEGVNNFVSLDFSSGRISTHPKHLRIQCLQGFVGSAHTRPPE